MNKQSFIEIFYQTVYLYKNYVRFYDSSDDNSVVITRLSPPTRFPIEYDCKRRNASYNTSIYTHEKKRFVQNSLEYGKYTEYKGMCVRYSKVACFRPNWLILISAKFEIKKRCESHDYIPKIIESINFVVLLLI